MSWRRSSCGLRWRAMKDSRYDAVWLLAGLPYWNHWCDVRVIFEVGAWQAGFEFGPFFLVLPAKVGLWRGRFTKVRFYTVGLLSKGWWLSALIDYADPWRVFVRKSWSQTHVDSFWTLFLQTKLEKRNVWRVLIRKISSAWTISSIFWFWCASARWKSLEWYL